MLRHTIFTSLKLGELGRPVRELNAREDRELENIKKRIKEIQELKCPSSEADLFQTLQSYQSLLKEMPLTLDVLEVENKLKKLMKTMKQFISAVSSNMAKAGLSDRKASSESKSASHVQPNLPLQQEWGDEPGELNKKEGEESEGSEDDQEPGLPRKRLR